MFNNNTCFLHFRRNSISNSTNYLAWYLPILQNLLILASQQKFKFINS